MGLAMGHAAVSPVEPVGDRRERLGMPDEQVATRIEGLEEVVHDSPS
jgi:hypothetical protein